MKKPLEKLKKGKLLSILKVLGVLLLLVILFGVYNSVVLQKSFPSSPSKILRQNITLENLKESKNSVSKMDYSSDIDSEGLELELEDKDLMMGSGGFTQGDNRTTLVAEKRVIKNGFLNLKVKSADTATKEISQIVLRNQGEIFSSNFNEYRRGSKTGTITVKVPVANFQKTFQELKAVATQVISESTSGQDVTERYIDLQAQLKNKQAEEETFVSLLDRAGKLEDVLNVSREIARVRGEIERLQGKIKYLESQTDMSTITVNISEDIEVTPIGDDWRPLQVVKKALNDLKKQSQDFVDAMIRFVIVTLPSLIPFAIFLLIVYWVGKKIYRAVSRK